MSPRILKFAVGLLRGKKREDTRVVGEVAGGEYGMTEVAERLLGHPAVIADFVRERFGLHAHQAEFAPARDGHAFDELGFIAGQRLVFVEELTEKRGEVGVGFSFNEEGLREKGAAGSVHGGDAPAFGSFGPTGFGAVDAGGLALTF
jgi:hypothetical protein